MNRFIPLFAIAFLMIAQPGCKRDNTGQDKEGKFNSVSTAIIGTWELSKTTGAMNPNPTIYTSGNGNLLKFTASGYEKYQNGVLVKTGTYTIVQDLTVSESVCLNFDAGRYTDRIIYDNDNSSPKQFFEISNNKLNFIAGCYAYDAGHTMEYQKQ